MRFDVLTLFPEAFDSFRTTSLIGKALDAGKIELHLHNIRDFSTDKHHCVDDVPYGGGAGMVMTCQPLFDCINHVKELAKDDAPVIFLTPHGQTFTQPMAESLGSDHTRLILLCGHYEGIDQRIRDTLVDTEISIGNYVLTGGEIPAQVLVDAVARLRPGVIGKVESHQEESFSQKLGRNQTEYPHYTRPAEYQGQKVPEILLSGHHAQIEKWRTQMCQKKD